MGLCWEKFGEAKRRTRERQTGRGIREKRDERERGGVWVNGLKYSSETACLMETGPFNTNRPVQRKEVIQGENGIADKLASVSHQRM